MSRSGSVNMRMFWCLDGLVDLMICFLKKSGRSNKDPKQISQRTLPKTNGHASFNGICKNNSSPNGHKKCGNRAAAWWQLEQLHCTSKLLFFSRWTLPSALVRRFLMNICCAGQVHHRVTHQSWVLGCVKNVFSLLILMETFA